VYGVRSINPPIVRRESGQLRPSGGERIVILRRRERESERARERESERERGREGGGGGLPVPPVRALKEDRARASLCPYCARVRKLHYHRHHPKRIDIFLLSPPPSPWPPGSPLHSLSSLSIMLARDPRDHRRAAECAKVGRENEFRKSDPVTPRLVVSAGGHVRDAREALKRVQNRGAFLFLSRLRAGARVYVCMLMQCAYFQLLQQSLLQSW